MHIIHYPTLPTLPTISYNTPELQESEITDLSYMYVYCYNVNDIHLIKFSKYLWFYVSFVGADFANNG